MFDAEITCSLKDEADFCPCSLEGVMKYLGRSWSMLIIGVLGYHHVLRYSEIQKKLGGLNPKTLSTRLKELECLGVVIRVAYNKIPPRVEYRLSEKGTELYDLLVPLMKWAAIVEHELKE